MKLHFAYNLDKDIENILNGMRSMNNYKTTKFQNLFIDKYGKHFEPEKIKAFISERDKINGFDTKKEIANVVKKWKTVKLIFIERIENIFGCSYPAPIITVYLTHDERCTYNIEKNYFFIKIGSEFSNNTIMHELMHFYTRHIFYKKLMAEGLSKLLYNDIKESLTELLNLEFFDLMDGKSDKGYSQHAEMRATIKRLWLKKKNINEIVSFLGSIMTP